MSQSSFRLDLSTNENNKVHWDKMENIMSIWRGMIAYFQLENVKLYGKVWMRLEKQTEAKPYSFFNLLKTINFINL